MQVNPLSTYSNAFAYLRYKFPQMVDSFANIPVIELTYGEWDEFSFAGYGYLVREEDIANVKNQIDYFSSVSPEVLELNRSFQPEMNRDLHIYDLYKKLGTVPFFLILEGNEAAIIHEVAHIVWSRLSPEEQAKIDLPEVSTPDDDQYMQSDKERFTHMTEMEYFKSQGMSFNDYFRLHNANEWRLINDPNADPQLKSLAQMDYNDYQQIWNHVQASSSRKNWFTKLAEGLTVSTGTHDRSGRPIYILQGPTYPIKGKLGRNGLGFSYWRPVGWWMYQDRMTTRVSSALQTLGFDLSALGGASPAVDNAPSAPGAPEPQMGAEPPVEPATAAPVAPTGVTDQSWDGTEPKSRWYGFPIKNPIYETIVQVEVNGQSFDLKVTLGRWFKKARRRVPSYMYNIFWNDQTIGRLAKASPSDWGTYDEGEIAGAIPAFIQERMALGTKSKMYNSLIYYIQLSGRDQELTEYLQGFEGVHNEETGWTKNKIDKTIHLDEPGYEGDFPVKFFAYSDGINWYGETALEHPHAPRPKTIFYMGDVPASVRTVDEFHQWLENRINEPKIMDRAKELYLDYLKSFHYSEAEQAEALGHFGEIIPIIEGKVTDPNFFRGKLMEHGYIRPKRNRRRTGPGMQPQDSIELILDTRKIVDDSYDWGKISTSPNYFYSVLAYLMHRKKAGNIGWGSHQINSSIYNFGELLKRYGATIDADGLYDYIDSLASKLLNEVIGVQSRNSAWDNYENFYGDGGVGVGDGGGDVFPEAPGLDMFIQFAASHGLDPATIKSDPKKAWRILAHKFHPDRNPNNPEVEAQFIELGNLWSNVPEQIRQSAESWLYRVCLG